MALLRKLRIRNACRIRYNLIDYWVEDICKVIFDKDPTSGAMIQAGEIGYATGAHVQGWKSEPIVKDDGDTYYDYFITGAVYSPKEPGLKFEVYAEPGHYRVLGVTEIGEGEEWFIFNQETALNFTSTQEYSKVCIDFVQSEHDLYDYFDMVPEDGKVCNYITGD